MYWLTGSQQIKLMSNIQESLAGRVGIVKLNSLTYSEIVQNNQKKVFEPNNLCNNEYINVNDLFKIIFRGGMPELYDIKEMSKQDYFYSYVETYLSQDVKEQLNIFIQCKIIQNINCSFLINIKNNMLYLNE